ncbi:MAG: hypothetical protein ACPLZF_04695 [Nitrososphaeria archaeon]
MVFLEVLGLARMVLEVTALVITFLAFLISYKGYSVTKRPVFARLSFAFIFLSANFMLQFFSDIFNILEFFSLSYYSSVISSFFEMLGFFFIAVSHMIKVSQEHKIYSLLLALVIINPVVAFKTLSLYFIFYAILESLLSYSKVRSKNILLTVLGLTGFALNTLLTWISEFTFYPIILNFFALVFQTFGVIAFFVPIWIYYRSVR